MCIIRNNISFAPNNLMFNPITPTTMKKNLVLAALLTALTVAIAQPNHYITFNGIDQNMLVPHHEDFNTAAGQSFTLTGWVRNETYASFPRYVCKRDMSVQNAGNERTGYEFFGTGGAEILNVTLTQDTRKAGRGNQNDVLLKAAVSFGGDNAVVELRSMVLNLEGTSNSEDIEIIKVYSTGTVNSFDERHPQNASLLGSVAPASGDLTCNLEGNLVTGTNYLWVVAQVADDATEGNMIDASLKSITTAEETYELDNPSPAGNREIILAHTLLLQPGDYNSTNYRIPAVITAKDGSIVAVTDKRKFNEGDLPEDIDIVCNRSTDGGHTWSEPYTIALGTGVNHGFGDCALAWSNDDNGLIAGFVGGPGLWYSTPANPIRTYICKSYDNGQTWTEPEDITDFIFGDNCIIPEQRTWRASFFGSGNGLRTSTGRIIFVAAIRETTEQVLYNHAVYSDDNGQTWHVSGRASSSGDEAKVAELADGRILMSIRHAGNRWYNISEDGGETWQPTTSIWHDITAPACNGDMIRFTSENQGHDKNRLLHSVPYGNSRTDVTVYVSYDEGETWPVKKCIVPYSSAYSSLCILPDGTIGLYVEEAYAGASGYSTVFYNFSLNWLSDGNDPFDPSGTAENLTIPDALKIYPVPASSFITIEAEGIKTINIYNATGQLVKSISANGASEVRLDVSEWPSGVYFVEGTIGNGLKRSGQFVK